MSDSAGRSPRSWALFLIATAIGLAADLFSKSLAFARIADTAVIVDREEVMNATQLGRLLPPHDPVVVIPSLLEFTLVLNPGAVFGIGAGKRWFFVIFTMVAVMVATWLFARKTKSTDRWAHLGLALVISGGLGNLYDRVRFACVRDFIHPLPGVRLPFGLNWPNGSPEVWPYVSNVADLFLLVGIGILMVYTWRKQPDESTESTRASG